MMSPEERQALAALVENLNERFDLLHTSLKVLAEHADNLTIRMNALERIIIKAAETELEGNSNDTDTTK